MLEYYHTDAVYTFLQLTQRRRLGQAFAGLRLDIHCPSTFSGQIDDELDLISEYQFKNISILENYEEAKLIWNRSF